MRHPDNMSKPAQLVFIKCGLHALGVCPRKVYTIILYDPRDFIAGIIYESIIWGLPKVAKAIDFIWL